jgi:hypothetical protein
MKKLAAIAAIASLAVFARADGTVTFNLSSPSNGATVGPGESIAWTITVTVSTSDNLGLALAAVSLVQDASNPASFELPPGQTPLDMTDFDRPEGISNPGAGGVGSAYGGTPMGSTGHKDLIQIGGAQNTFGVAGDGIGLDYDVRGGVGQSGPQILATGAFLAPAALGVYAFNLQNAIANTIEEIAAPPFSSPISGAAALIGSGQITFTVSGPAVCTGDLNCDGAIGFGDINPFVLYLSNNPAWASMYVGCNSLNGDINGDGTYGPSSFGDINPFVTLLTAAPLGCP